MRNKLFVLWLVAIIAAAAGAIACFDKIQNIAGSTQGQNQGGSGDPTALPTPASSCGLPTIEVRVSVHGGGSSTFGVGETISLDATPLSQAGRIEDACNTTKRVLWAITGPCRLGGDTGGFNPDLKGEATGECFARATVDNVQSADLNLHVR